MTFPGEPVYCSPQILEWGAAEHRIQSRLAVSKFILLYGLTGEGLLISRGDSGSPIIQAPSAASLIAPSLQCLAGHVQASTRG